MNEGEGDAQAVPKRIESIAPLLYLFRWGLLLLCWGTIVALSPYYSLSGGGVGNPMSRYQLTDVAVSGSQCRGASENTFRTKG